MVKEGVAWFNFADVDVTVTPWAASYALANTPTSWIAGQGQTYTVTVTNIGSQPWAAAGNNPVHLMVSFVDRPGGFGNNLAYTHQRFNLPADLAPGSSVPLTISPAPAPNTSGTQVLEYQMVAEGILWFGQFADVSVNIAPG
jgi:hypothetical protein